MGRTLGLDIGTTSIGWCLMEDKNRIVRTGVRIFPVGVQEDKYNKSKVEESKNAGRRMARGIRRGYDRYKLRRKQLRRILLELNMLPERLEMPSARALYELRVKGLDEQLTLTEFGRVVLHLNQRRGFKSNRKAATKDGEDERGIKLQMTELKQKVVNGGFRTLGEYFLSLYEANNAIENWHNPDEPVERVRKRFVHRSMYEAEFEAIWQAQTRYYPTILTEERRREMKDRCIYYQRPLKSQKGRVGKCRFEPKKRVSPRSSLRFQEFRIWQTLSNIRVTDAKRNQGPLSIEEKQILAAVLKETGELKIGKIKTLLHLSRGAYLNDIDKIKGNTTAGNVIEAIGSNLWRSLPDERREHIWHVLYFASDESWLRKWAEKNLGLSTEEAEAFGEVSLEPDYSRISHKAIEKMLPFLRQGLDYSEASKAAGYHHSFDEEKEGKQRELEDKIVRKPNDEIEQLRNPMVMRAVSETITLVNAIIQEEGRPDQVRIEFARSMRMPREAREKMLSKNRDKDRQRDEYREFLKNKLGWSDIKRSQITKFELWLEMEYAEEDLRKINGSINLEDFRRFAKNAKPSDRTKYDLWLQCNRISPYTGKPISLSKLFSYEIEIEHIIPYSRSLDNSFRNKTLSEREFNAEKGKQTPFEYFKSRPKEMAAFKERIKNLPRGKQSMMLREEFEPEFRPGMLESTATIARETRKVLRRVCKDVRTTDGQVTSLLRRFWGLNTILNLQGDNEKSRSDHRHHAVDAFVIANTDDWWINLLSRASEFDGSGRQMLDETKIQSMLLTDEGKKLARATGMGIEADNDPLGLQQSVLISTGEIVSGGIPGPYTNYRRELESSLDGLLISYKNDKRLISAKANKYRYSHPQQGEKKLQRSIAVRGALHSESVFGQIENSHKDGALEYVIRKSVGSLDKMKQVDKIVDPAIRKIVVDHIENNGGESKIKDAMQKPLYLTSKDGKKRIPIHSVRVVEPAKQLIQLRPKENPKLFVDSGSNYCIAIYQDENSGKRAFEILSFFEAAKRARAGKTIVEDEKNGKPLLMTLRINDMLVTYDAHRDEIVWDDQTQLSKRLYRVVKLTGSTIYAALHNWSGVRVDYPREYPSGVVLSKSANLLKASKAKISQTGKIEPYHNTI